MKPKLLLPILAMACGLAACNNPATPPTTVDTPVVKATPNFPTPPAADILFSFAFVGCNRIDDKDTLSPFTDASTANVPQLQRTFSEIASLDPKPTFFFFLGDLVLGLEEDSTILGEELRAWVKQYESSSFSQLAGSGISLIAIPGNHEMLYMEDGEVTAEPTSKPTASKGSKPGKSHKKHKKPKGTEVPWEGAIGTWMQYMSPFMPQSPISRVPGPDSLWNLQTYSFDFQNTHFIVLNTDTYNEEGEFGQFPVEWVVQDIAAARANPATQHIFLLSHKPAYVSPGNAADDMMDTTLRAQLWPAMVAHQAEALLSAHSHQYQRSQPVSQPSYQVVAGNGGSPYVKDLAPANQYMGWSIIYVMKNGDLLLQSWGRDVPADNYLDSIPAGDPTTLRDSANLRWQ